MFKQLRLLFRLLVFTLVFASTSLAQSCQLGTDSKVLETVSASAGNWANLRNNPGSLRFESDKLLRAGHSLLKSAQSSNKIAVLILTSVPQKSLSDYSDKAYCQAKLDTTLKSPIKFEGLTFSAIEDLSKWFSDFSQGSGVEGKKLYGLCDKTCSPHYSLQITEKAGKLNVEANVLCGHARDKSDDMYTLCTGAKA
jgi:hypothetical protein